MSINNLIKNLHFLEERNSNFLHVTAYENQVSPLVQSFLSSKLSERYYFGGGTDGIVDWEPFTCLGLESVEDLVLEAEKAAKHMLSASIVNLKCLSGVHAMMSVILATTNPRDVIMTVHHNDGGHFITKNLIERVGRQHVFASYDLNKLNFNPEETAYTFKKLHCKVLYLDISYYINPVNIRELRNALGKEAIIVFDASHTIGLMMGQVFQSPLEEGADIVCANTHKTLPGPQKGLIVFKNKQLGESVGNIIDSTMVSSSHTHHLIALALTILEMKKYGKNYAKQIIKNSNALGHSLVALGYEVRKTISNNYSFNHQVHLYLDNKGERRDMYKKLIANYISTNFDDRMGGRLFARLGTQEITRRGMKEKDMAKIAYLLDKSIKGENVREQVINFNQRFSKIFFGFH